MISRLSLTVAVFALLAAASFSVLLLSPSYSPHSTSSPFVEPVTSQAQSRRYDSTSRNRLLFASSFDLPRSIAFRHLVRFPSFSPPANILASAG